MEALGYVYDNVELQIFADATEYAFGAAAYVRYASDDSADCRLVVACSNLAPTPTDHPAADGAERCAQWRSPLRKPDRRA